MNTKQLLQDKEVKSAILALIDNFNIIMIL